MRLPLWLGAILLAAVLPLSSVFAAATDFELLDPNPAPQGGLMLESPRPITGLLSVGGYLHQQRAPVIFGRVGGAKSVDRLVSHRLQLRAVAAFNVLDYGQVVLDIPMTLASGVKLNDRRVNVTTLNDPLLKLKAPFFTIGQDLRWTLGAALDLKMALGDAENFAGSDGRFIQPALKLLNEVDRDKWQLRATLGWREREQTILDAYRLTIDDLLLFRLGYALNTQLGRTWFFEYAGSTAMADLFGNAAHDANELVLGWQVPWRDWVFTPAATVGLSKAFGVPTWRVLFSAFWQMPAPQPLNAVEVVVQDGGGQPLAGANVKIISTSGDKAANSDRNGLATFGRLKDGPVEVIVSKDDFHEARQTANLSGGQPQTLTFALKSSLARLPLAIFVYDAQSKRPVAARIDAVVQMGTRSETLELASGADGVTVAAIIPGIVNLTVRADGYQNKTVEVSAAKGQEFQVDLGLEKDFANALAAGQGAQNRLSRVSFEFVDAASALPASEVVIASPMLGVVDRSDSGEWTLVIEPGRYEFVFGGDDYFPVKVSGEILNGGDERHHTVQLAKRGKELVVVGASEIYITEKIFFATGSAKILAKSFAVLDALAHVLNEYQDIRKVLIKGHTDNVGKRTANITLSRERAKSVLTYLVAKGVDAERLAFEGYGPDQPLADNGDEEGRSINRRVEFEILQRGEVVAPPPAPAKSANDFTEVTPAAGVFALDRIVVTKLEQAALPQFKPSVDEQKSSREKFVKYDWDGPTGVLSLKVIDESTGQPPFIATLGFNAGEKAGGVLRRNLGPGGAISQELPPGKVTVTIGAPGYYPAVQESEIVDGSTTTLQVVIRPLSMELESVNLEDGKIDVVGQAATEKALINLTVQDYKTGQSLDKAHLYLLDAATEIKLTGGATNFEVPSGRRWLGVRAEGYHGGIFALEVTTGEYDAKLALGPVQVQFKVAKFGEHFRLADDRIFVDKQAKLSPEGQETLSAFARYLTANVDIAPLTVEAHTLDGKGQSDRSLASARADAIVAALVAGGVAEDRLRRHIGDSPMPIAPPKQAGAEYVNNRIVFYRGQPVQDTAATPDLPELPEAPSAEEATAPSEAAGEAAEDLLKDLQFEIDAELGLDQPAEAAPTDAAPSGVPEPLP